MSVPEPAQFADQWIRAWNARDPEAVLAHYADDATFTSPVAARVVPESRGVIRGKEALRDYWGRALQGNGDLHFLLLGVYVGVDTLVVNYENQRGVRLAEVMIFENGLITRGQATALHEA
jgi:ketosteroid isomerase-like protein